MVGGGRGGGGGGGIISDQLVWEVLLFPSKEWGTVVVTRFPKKGKEIHNDDVIHSGLAVYPL